jgi:hypothetical protein
MEIHLNDNITKEDNFLKAIEISYINLERQIRIKRAAAYMILAWKTNCEEYLDGIEDINNEYLFTEAELRRIFNVVPQREDLFKSILDKYAGNCIYPINHTHYFSLPKIIESYWVLERIVPLTFFWEKGEFCYE